MKKERERKFILNLLPFFNVFTDSDINADIKWLKFLSKKDSVLIRMTTDLSQNDKSNMSSIGFFQTGNSKEWIVEQKVYYKYLMKIYNRNRYIICRDLRKNGIYNYKIHYDSPYFYVVVKDKGNFEFLSTFEHVKSNVYRIMAS